MSRPRTGASLLLLLALAPWPAGAEEPVVERARAALEAGHAREAARLAAKRVEVDAKDAQAWRALGAAHARRGAIPDAIEAYRQAIAAGEGLDPRSEVALARLEDIHVGVGTGTGRLIRVIDAGRAGGFRAAADLVAFGNAASLLAPRDPNLYRLALDAFERAIEADPADPAPHVALGDLLLDRYNGEEALEAYREALARDDRYPPALLGLARSRHFDQTLGALEAVRRALDERPDYVEALALLARLEIELEAYAQAEDAVARALAVNPRAPEALTLAAAIHFLRAEPSKYAAAMARLQEATPGYVRAFTTLAEVAAQNRRYREAVDFARTAVRLDPGAWRAHALLGINRLRLGDIDAGRASLDTAFRGDPFDPWTKNTLDLLDRMDAFDQTRSAHFVLVSDPRETPVIAPRALEIAESAFTTFSERYDYTPPTPLRIELHPSHEDFSVRTIGLVGADIVGVSFGPVLALDSPSAGAFGPLNWASVLWHELAHTFHLGLTGARVPRWFSEGLAVHEERRARPGWGADPTPAFLAAFAAGELPPATRLNDVFLAPESSEQIGHAYYLGSLLMEMIEDEHGFDAILALLHGYREGGETGPLLEAVLGQDVTTVDASFDAYVRGRFARALAAVAPGPGALPGRFPRLMSDAEKALDDDDLEGAETLLVEARSLFPEHAGPGSAHRLLADVYMRRAEPARAIVALARAVDIDADDLEAHRHLAALHREAGNLSGAIAVTERALLIDPFDPVAHRHLAEDRALLGDWAGAATARAALVALDPDDPAAARYRLAEAHANAAHWPAARVAVLSALERAPLYDEALELLLRIRERLDDRADSQP